ncbi:MAG: L-histidine N(alpha)-methyltransferase, partial [Gemmatimonadetes bacterium]|nr:L-histidine N(alpha)-methyltransferase [Gemmatimonadota bacterium]
MEFARAVACGLSDTPRWVPSRFLYDARGSQLFEQICELPEYYL